MVQQLLHSKQDEPDIDIHGLIGPQNPPNDQLITVVAGEYAYHVARLLFQIHGQQLHRRSRGLLALLGLWLGNEADFKLAWDGVFSDVSAAMRSKQAGYIAESAAALALHLSVHGLTSDWEIALDRPARLRWERWLLPAGERIAVQSDGTTATIRTALGHTWHQASLRRAMHGWDADGLEALPVIGDPRDPIILTAGPAFLATASDDAGRSVAGSRLSPRMITAWQSTLDLLGAPPLALYQRWVERVVVQVMIVDQTEQDSINSRRRFGVIHGPSSDDPLLLLEVLVREAAYQYFDLIGLVAAIDDGSDTFVYPMSDAGDGYSLTQVASMYHALTHIRIVQSLCHVHGIARMATDASAPAHLAALHERLGAILNSSDALTAVGCNLFDTLRGALAHLSGGQ